MRVALVLVALFILPACGPADEAPVATLAEAVEGERAVPAGSTALAPRLSTGGDAPLLSWTETDGDTATLRYARWTGDGWGPAETADEGAGRFVNWADTPGVVALDSGRLLAHSLVMHPDGDSPYAYDVRVVQEGADGAWGTGLTPHTDGVAAEHGFVSVVPLEGDRAGLVWLDGRNQGGGHGHDGGAMTLRFAALGPNGTLGDESELDARVCDCCPTAAARTPGGVVVAYRDRSPGEVRDIAVIRRTEQGWTETATPHPDGWVIAGCPVNGPALAAQGERVALAWYTGADSGAGVFVSVSDDGGASFGPRVRVDEGAPLGRVGVALAPDGSALVSWLEGGAETADVRVRRVAGATAFPPRSVATVPATRESGVPVLTALGDRVVVAWTVPQATPSVRTAVVEVLGADAATVAETR